MNVNFYKQKYLKYKRKYLELRGGAVINDNIQFFNSYDLAKRIVLQTYKQFRDLTMVEMPLKKIGGGNNGFALLLIYKNSIPTDSRFGTILKVNNSANEYHDNLYYEYFVGKCINKIKKYYPNFAYTIGYGHIKKELFDGIANLYDVRVDIKSPITKEQVMDGLEFKNVSGGHLLKTHQVRYGCTNHRSSFILLEDIGDNIDLFSFIKYQINPRYDYDLFCILYQLYSTLDSLKGVYTHYDLIFGNVLLKKYSSPVRIVYYDSRYVAHDEIVLITQYVPVIIDYGRSHIDCSVLNTNNIVSDQFMDKACSEQDCSPKIPGPVSLCDGVGVGIHAYKVNDKYDQQADYFYINPVIANNAHDLRLFHDIMERVPIDNDLRIRYSEVFNIANNPEWFVNRHERKFGVGNQVDSYDADGRIKTVSDAVKFLKKYYYDKEFKGYDELYVDDLYGEFSINSNFAEMQKCVFKKIATF